MIVRQVNWLIYKNKITINGKVIMNFGAGILGTKDKKQIVLGKNVRLSGWLTVLNNGKITIGDYSLIGSRSVIQAWNKVEIGSYTMISPDVWIQDNNSHSIYAKDRYKDIISSKDFNDIGVDNTNAICKPIKIGNHVWIGRRALILKGVDVGDRSIVAAGAVVTKNVPPDTIVAGNPARVVKRIKQKTINPDMLSE